MTRICHLCNEEIKIGECIGHMKYKLVIVHSKCLTKPLNFRGDTIVELMQGIIHSDHCGENAILKLPVLEQNTDTQESHQAYIDKDKNQKIVKHLKNHISKIDKWLEQYRDGINPEIQRKPQAMSDEIWFDIEEQRYEYLEGLRSTLQFMIDYPEREQIV